MDKPRTTPHFFSENFDAKTPKMSAMETDIKAFFSSVHRIQVPSDSKVRIHLEEINARLVSGLNLLEALHEHFSGERFRNLRFGSPKTVKSQIRGELKQQLRFIFLADPVAQYVFDEFFRSYNFPAKRRIVGTFLTMEELGVCITQLGPRTALWMEFLYFFGGRVTEACNIRLEDVRDVYLKGRRDPSIVSIRIREGKTDADAEVLLSADLIASIKRTFNGKVFLFETSNGRQYRRQDVYNLMAGSTERLLGRRVTPHDMRRTFADTNLEEHPELEDRIITHGRWKDIATMKRSYKKRRGLHPDQFVKPIRPGNVHPYRSIRRLA